MLFLCVSSFGAWYWYYSLYQYQWSDSQKKSFLESYAKETEFRASRFNGAVKSVQQRQDEFGKDPAIVHDMFQLDREPKTTGQ